MGMVMGLWTVSDSNIERVIADPPLIWQVVAREDPELYESARREQRGFFAKLLNKQSERPPDLDLREHEGAETDLDKAWHGVHYLLTRTADAGPAPENFLLAGGRPAGDLEVGYGPVRLHMSAEVKSFHAHLASVTNDELCSRFNAQDMMKLKIYPEIWSRQPDELDPLGYLAEHLDTLRNFIELAAQRDMGIAISIT